MKKRLPLIILESFTLLFVLVTVIYCFLAGNYEKTTIETVDKEIENGYLIDGSHYRYDELPVHISAKKGTPISIRTSLPGYMGDDYSICFLALYCKCEVYAAGELIGSYGAKQPLNFGRMVGNIRVLIPVEQKYAGATLEIVLTPYYNLSNMDISAVKIGTTGDLKATVVKGNYIRVVMISILFTLIVTSIVLLINQIYEKSNINVRLFGNFIILVFFVACWLYCSSDLPQLYTNANEAVSLVSFLSLSCLTVPYAGFCEQMFRRRQKIFYRLQLLGWCIPLLNVFLFVTNLADPMEVLILTHIYMIVVVVTSVVFAFLEPQKTLETKFFFAGVILLLISAIGGFICYFAAPSKGYDGIMFGIGFILFIASLFLLILARQVSLIKERQNLNAYKHLAYSNVITGLSNRNAFDEDFSTMGSRLAIGEPVTLYLVDFLNHKDLIEEFGHRAGDDALRLMGQNLEKAFKNVGKCYHFGGDEFAVIIEQTMVDVRKLKSAFEDLSSHTGFMYEAKLETVVGYSTLPFEDSSEFEGKLMDRAAEAVHEEERRLNAIRQT